jgi:hypothetical protein
MVVLYVRIQAVPAIKHGPNNTRNRDVEAAKCIAIASTCQILKRSRPLPLAKNKISQSNTEASTFTAVMNADAQPVTDISRTLHH